jgi:hypothetical protein
MKFSIDPHDSYVMLLRAVLRRQRRFKRKGMVYAGIKAPTDPETRSKALMWADARQRETLAWDQTRALIGHLRRLPQRLPRVND